MNRKVCCLRVLVGFLVLLLAAPPWTLAQSSGAATFSQEELDQMLAPVALYPDSLLAQMLVAATFPAEVVEADQWVRQNQDLKGDELNDALDKMDWDLSVKALVPFPQVLAMMSDKREWTQRLGDAFLAQETEVMDTIQGLRTRAHAQGNLKSTDEQQVVVKGESIEILPANPRVVYVPAYNPISIYGPWWHSAYPPYAYNPYYPGYAYDPYYTGAGFITAGVFGFAAGVAVGSIWNSGWGHWDWGRRNAYVNVNRTININRNDIRIRNIRTTNVNRVVTQRRTGATGAAGLRTSGPQGAKARPSAASVQKGLQQREGKAEVRKGKSAAQGSQTKVRSDRGQKGSAVSAERSKGQRGSAVSAERSKGQRGSAVSAERSKGQRGSAVSAERSKGQRGSAVSAERSRGGDSLRGGGAGRRGGKSPGSVDGSIGGGKSRGDGGAGGAGQRGGGGAGRGGPRDKSE